MFWDVLGIGTTPKTRLAAGIQGLPALGRTNQLRVLPAALGYVLIERLRALALQGTALTKAQVDTLRIDLRKLAAVVTRNTRRIHLYLASNWARADIFAHAVRQLRLP